MTVVFVDRVKRFSLEVDEDTGKAYLGIPVRNSLVEYTEWYAVEAAEFERYKEDPTLAHDFVGKAKRREIDHLLIFKPGRERGEPECP